MRNKRTICPRPQFCAEMGFWDWQLLDAIEWCEDLVPQGASYAWGIMGLNVDEEEKNHVEESEVATKLRERMQECQAQMEKLRVDLTDKQALITYKL